MFSSFSVSELIILLGSLVVAMAFHEAMHGFVAHWLGDTTAKDAGRLTLNPLKHIDLMTTIILPFVLIITTGTPIFAAKPVPFDPRRLKYGEYGMALVGIAGPLTNLVLAALAAVIFHLFYNSLTAFSFNVITIFTDVNIALFVFNMIPIPPLDGSRLLYAFAPEPLQELMQRIEAMGFIVVLLILLILFQFISGIIGSIDSSLQRILLGI